MKEGNTTIANLGIPVAVVSSVIHWAVFGSNAMCSVKNTDLLNLEFRMVLKGFLIKKCFFAMKAAELPTHYKATNDTEMDDFVSVICFLYIIILVMKQSRRKIPTSQCQYMTKLCRHIQLKTEHTVEEIWEACVLKIVTSSLLRTILGLEAAYSQLRTLPKVY